MIEQKNKGWIKLSRDITDHWIWTDEFSRGQAWIDLLLHASHSDNQKMMIKGEVITWHRGQQIRSIKTLERSWKWSRSKVNRFLELLEKDGMIERKGGHLTTIISICNYGSFQSSRTSVDTSDVPSVDTSDGHLTDISRATNKNDKNEKESKNDKEISNLPAKAGEKKTEELNFDQFRMIDMTESQIDELKKIRRDNKGGKITQRVINALAKEFNLSIDRGISIENILDEWASRGWKSYKDEWMRGNNYQQAGRKSESESNDWVDILIEGEII